MRRGYAVISCVSACLLTGAKDKASGDTPPGAMKKISAQWRVAPPLGLEPRSHGFGARHPAIGRE